jgi:hypothetical protein
VLYRPAKRRHIPHHDHRSLRLQTEAPTEGEARRGVSVRPDRQCPQAQAKALWGVAKKWSQGGKIMNRLIPSVVIVGTIICGLVFPREEASAQTTNDLVGTWSLVSSTVEQNGQKRDAQGPNPKGLLILDSGGHYAVLTFRQDQPKFASNNRLEATAEESRSLLAGTLGHYGTYSPAGNVLVFHIERSTFPNWNGIEQKRPYTLNGDELTYVTPGSTGAGVTQLVWRRVK